MWFLFFVLLVTTSLLCYAGYIFLIVDKRQAKQVLENPEVYEALDDKEYDFELPVEIEEYEELRESKPADKRTLPLALLKRAMADIPLIEVSGRHCDGCGPSHRPHRGKIAAARVPGLAWQR